MKKSTNVSKISTKDKSEKAHGKPSHVVTAHSVEPLTNTVPDVARQLGCSERFVWKEIYERRLACVRLGSRVKITSEQLKEYLHKNSVATFNAQKKCSKILLG